ncbi:sacsin N-terminal ATP-binding-like domain-containing protein [Actinomadura sp. NTSP31]|uniref:sacsin N-terminal ATP-binding-like domain-containing protein n=1 Tax=Actinomadura sp. NTSP31 TaxID=1735447 RepID=UPI0035BFF574
MAAWQDWAPNFGLAQEIEDQFERAIASYRANSNLVTEHANHEESIRVGGYANRTLLELVQNSADAMSGAGSDQVGAGRVEIVLDARSATLYCANAGRPFSKSGLTAITHAHLSGKRGDEIGRFGLGFKSVLAVTDRPQVFSRSVSFEFNSAEARAAIAAVGAPTKRLPVLRTATLVDPTAAFEQDPVLAELAEWAVTIVKLPRASNLARLQKEIEEFRSEFLLFVTDVREIRLRVIGDEGETFNTSHISRDLGGGRFKIDRPDGTGDEWLVDHRMHSPTPEARLEVGEAVSRDQVKVTVAMPARNTRHRVGEFWSYFPLRDETSASALFNAPWSVNDDRTTLLKNRYNQEILTELSKMFVAMLPRVASTDDPAAHLDYMPARGRETLSFGDDILCSHVPGIAAKLKIVPDATGELQRAEALRPLDFLISGVSEQDHKQWIDSPNTGDDVPHWRCYATPQRRTRLRQLCVFSIGSDELEVSARDEKRALERMPKRGVLTWLREWAEGPDLGSAARALAFVIHHSQIEGIEGARVIPTQSGICTLKDRNDVFLARVDDVDIEGARFVDAEFLAIPGIDKILRAQGFRDLDPLAILRARLNKLAQASGDEELSKFWDAVMNVPMPEAERMVSQASAGLVRVPTRNGEWSWPNQVLDIDGIADGFGERLLDRHRCLPQVAHAAGVVHGPLKEYSIEDEIFFEDYRRWIVASLNSRRGPGEREIERIDFVEHAGPGPFSVLLMLRDANALEQTREMWTTQLLSFGDHAWSVEDLDSGQTHRVVSPLRWSVEQAGLLKSTRGFRPPEETVSAALVEFADLLPLYRGPRQVEDVLDLPDELSGVPADVLREAFEAELFPRHVKDSTLTKFILAASQIAFPQGRPMRIPARVGQGVESRRPESVYLATTDEEQRFLKDRQKPYLRAEGQDVSVLVEAIGCRRFEDSFSFSMLIEGQQDEERLIDVYTGLRQSMVADKVANATVARAVHIAKRVTTEDGVEDRSRDWHIEGPALVVRADLGERRVLEIVNEAYGLGLSNAELSGVLKAGLDQRLEEQRQAAKAAMTDAERLEVFFGDDTLREVLPKGLWSALEAQKLVNDSTSVAELFLTVYRSESVKMLEDQFRDEGYTDVPTTWAGGASTIAWLRKMGFGAEYAGRRNQRQDDEFIVPGATRLNPLHAFQKRISEELKDALILKAAEGGSRKAMVELPTGAGKTRVATETVLRLFIDGSLRGPVLWIAQSAELCEQAVQTWSMVWRGLGDERPLAVGRLWDTNSVHEPDTEFSVIVATDAKLDVVIENPDYRWLSNAAAVIVDEAHRAGGSPRYRRILDWLGVAGRGWARPLIGLSATPFKGSVADGTQTRELAARFGNHMIRAFKDGNAYQELSQMGVLARVQHEVLPGIEVTLDKAELDQVTRLRKLEPGVLDRIGRDQARMAALVDHIMRQDPEWPILVFTPNVLSAQVLAATLRYRKVEAAAVSGHTGRQERREVIERFKSGDIRVLANCDLLIQGFDAPGVRALYIARPTFSPSAYIQMAGRGLRGEENGGKRECLIVDVADNFGAVNDFLGYREYEDLWLEPRA